MRLAVDKEADTQVRAIALDALTRLDDWLARQAGSERESAWRAHNGFARFSIGQMRTDPASIEQLLPVTVPPGEPIGTTANGY